MIFAKSEGKAVRRISLLVSALSCLSLLVFSAVVVYTNQAIHVFLYRVLPALEFSFLIDRLSAFFILVISVVSLAVALYSMDYVEHTEHKRRKNILVSLMNIFILSMILVTASANMFAFFVFWEIMAISSFFLVMFEFERKETEKAGIFYFIMTHLSTVFILFAFILLYSASGSFGMSPMSSLGGTTASMAFLLLFFGFGIKAGIIPFHKWLPYAHPASPSNISALMSGIMIKVAIYGMMRFFIFVLSPDLWWGILILIAGTVSAVLGVIYALKEHNLKRLLAYHSIENIGIILLGFGLYIIFSKFGLLALASLSLAGALFHTLNHALFKSLLFMTVGSVVNATETRNIEEMGGLIRRMPYTAAFFLIGAVSISALPPFNGFVSELMIFQALFGSGAIGTPLLEVLLIISLSVLALTSALAAACFVKAFGITFLAAPRSKEAEEAKEAPAFMLVGPGMLSVLCVALGVLSFQIFSFFGYSFPIPDLLLVGSGLVLSYVVVSAAMYLFASGKTRTQETWGCGILSQNAKMEYTASGFSEPIVTIFKKIYRTKKISERNFFDKKSSIFKDGSADIQLLKFFEEYMYMPAASFISSVSSRISGLQRGDVDLHVAYAFITIVVLLVAVGWFA